jgi:hypothetical protein
VSGALAADSPSLRATADHGAVTISNRARGLTARFDRTGVRLSAGSVRLHLRLRSLATAGGVTAVAAATPSARANGVSYVRPTLREWYRNGPLGLEQGFTVGRAPTGGGGTLALAMALSGNARATLSPDAQSVTLRHGGTSLTYGGLVATDASGRTLRGSLALSGGLLMLRVNVAHARYPLTIDPLIQKGAKLTSGAAGDDADFGTSAALSADGSTLLIGGPQDDDSQGAVWIFVRSGSSWVQQGPKQTPGETMSRSAVDECAEEAAEEAEECAFGNSVALSADGNTALVGDPSATSTRGAAWVFTRTDGSWTRGPTLTGGTGGDEGRFGKSVALSAGGSTALVGDPTAGNQRGKAWVFTRTGATWLLQEVLMDSEASQLAHFGRSVALSADGDTALIGGPGDSGFVGAAWQFTRAGAGWAQQGGKITGAGEVGRGHFGKTVALSGDAGTALIGAQDDNEERGAVWAFGRSGSAFVQPGEELVMAPAAGEGRFGASLALSNDGSTALIGAPHAETGIGAVTEWTRSGAIWTALPEQLGGSEAVSKGWTGASVALASDAEVAAIGAPRDAKNAGAAWVFSPSEPGQPTVTNVVPGHGPTQGGTEVEVRGENLNNAQAVQFGSTPATSFSVVSAARIRALTPAEPAGAVDVTVRTPAGTSAGSRAGEFVYESTTGESPRARKAKDPSMQGASSGDPGTTAASGGVLGSTFAAGAACRVSLRSKHVVVALHRSAAIRLLRTGTGQCRGKVALRYREKGKGKRFKLKPIGSVRFSIAPGKSQVVSIQLNKLGRSLFIAGHGKLNASVTVLRTMPAPTLANTASARLSVKSKPKARSVQK